MKDSSLTNKNTMNKFIIVLLMVLMFPLEGMTHHNSHTSRSRRCYKEIYEEEYIPGDIYRNGYVRRNRRTIQVPCGGNRHRHTHHSSSRRNDSCVEGALVGSILGGVIGGFSSDNDAVGIPIGIIGGAAVGCAIDNNN